MHIKDVVASVAADFEYRADPRRAIFDPWTVMKLKRGKLYGDCEDFTLTCLYRYLGFWGFIWRVMILHNAQIHFVSANGGGHFYVLSTSAAMKDVTSGTSLASDLWGGCRACGAGLVEGLLDLAPTLNQPRRSIFCHRVNAVTCQAALHR